MESNYEVYFSVKHHECLYFIIYWFCDDQYKSENPQILVSISVKVPVVSADPRMWGFKTKTRNGTNLPGVWADVENQHGIMFLADRNNRWKHQATHESSSASERWAMFLF